MMNKRPSPWEIWWAIVKFEDDPTQSKRRPVLVVSDKTAFIISLKITHHEPRAEFDGEYRVIRWQESGLTQPSTIRYSKKLKLFESDFVGQIGKLHPTDIQNLRVMLAEIIKRQ